MARGATEGPLAALEGSVPPGPGAASQHAAPQRREPGAKGDQPVKMRRGTTHRHGPRSAPTQAPPWCLSRPWAAPHAPIVVSLRGEETELTVGVPFWTTPHQDPCPPARDGSDFPKEAVVLLVMCPLATVPCARHTNARAQARDPASSPPRGPMPHADVAQIGPSYVRPHPAGTIAFSSRPIPTHRHAVH